MLKVTETLINISHYVSSTILEMKQEIGPAEWYSQIQCPRGAA